MNLGRTAVPGLKGCAVLVLQRRGRRNLRYAIMFGCISLTCEALAEMLLVAVGKAAMELTVTHILWLH